MTEVSADIVARGMIREAALPGGDMGPIVDTLRINLVQKGAGNTLEIAAGRSLDFATMTYVMQENIGTERTSNGDKHLMIGSEEWKRFQEANNNGALIKDYLEKGYEKLNATQKTKIEESLRSLAENIPGIASVLGPMSDTDKSAYFKRIFEDPRFSKIVKQLLLERSGDVSKIIPDEVSKLKNEFNVINTELTSIVKTMQDKQKKLEEATKNLAEYDPEVPQGNSSREGDQFKKIFALYQEVRQKDQERASLKGQLVLPQNELEKLNDELTKAKRNAAHSRPLLEIQNDISKTKEELTALTERMSSIESEIQERQVKLTYHKEKQEALKAEEKQLEKELEDLREKEKQLTPQKQEKESELAKAYAKRKMEEQVYVEGLKTIISNASEKYISERINETTEEAKKVIEKQTQEAKDGRKKIILEGLSKKYFVGNKINAELIRIDYNTLLGTGPDTIIESLLSSGSYSATQITEAKNDTAFMEEMRQKVGESVVKYFLLRGGLWTKGGSMGSDEILKIRESPWGQNLIENALKGRDDLRNEINKALGRNVVTTEGKLQESFRNLNFETIFKILLFILGLGGAGLFGISKI